MSTGSYMEKGDSSVRSSLARKNRVFLITNFRFLLKNGQWVSQRRKQWTQEVVIKLLQCLQIFSLKNVEIIGTHNFLFSKNSYFYSKCLNFYEITNFLDTQFFIF